MTRAGFPHSEIRASTPACGSTRLIAACHVLHRLPVPRHPPYALSILMVLDSRYAVFKDQTPSLSRARKGVARCHSSAPSQDPESLQTLKTEQQLLDLASRQPSAPLDRSKYPRWTAWSRRAIIGQSRPALEPLPCDGPPVGHCCPRDLLPRKEVIQPHLQVRLPCYDFTPVAGPTFADRLL